jgi:hypothetical protein
MNWYKNAQKILHYINWLQVKIDMKMNMFKIRKEITSTQRKLF